MFCSSLLVRDTDHISLVDLGHELKRDLSGLNQAASRLDKRMKKDRELVAQPPLFKLTHLTIVTMIMTIKQYIKGAQYDGGS